MRLRPDRGVLEGFGIHETPKSLAGGEGTSWLAGGLVLKPVSSEEEAEWTAEVLGTVDQVGFRAPRPVRSLGGSWVVKGWSCWTLVRGEHDFSDRWDEVLTAGARFHEALRGWGKPAFLDRRSTPWSTGDGVAWGEAPLDVSPPIRALASRFLAFAGPISLTNQVIHGDLTGNVLFARGQPPAIIDFSPYYRPPGYGLAVVVVDAIAWHEASTKLVDLLARRVDQPDQLIARAALYRLVAADRLSPGQNPAYAMAQVAAHERIASLIGA